MTTNAYYGSNVKTNRIFGEGVSEVFTTFALMIVMALAVFAFAFVVSSTGLGVLFAAAAGMTAVTALPFVVVKAVVAVMEAK